MTQLDLIKILVDLGGTVFIVVVLLLFAYKLLNRFGTAFIETQQNMAAAMGRQAECMSDMKDTVHAFIGKDNNEHREILLGLQVVGQQMKTLVEAVKELRK